MFLCIDFFLVTPIEAAMRLKYHFSYIVAVSFIGGGNRNTQRKPPACRKSLTNFTKYTSP
jgi:hypothetical protein